MKNLKEVVDSEVGSQEATGKRQNIRKGKETSDVLSNRRATEVMEKVMIM